jgi:hypothetical protein
MNKIEVIFDLSSLSSVISELGTDGAWINCVNMINDERIDFYTDNYDTFISNQHRFIYCHLTKSFERVQNEAEIISCDEMEIKSLFPEVFV